MKLGEQLLKAGLISNAQLESALQEQKGYGGRIGDILQAITNVRALDYYKTLAEHFSLPFVNLLTLGVDVSLLHVIDRNLYLEHQILPIAKQDGEFVVATANPTEEVFSTIKKYWGENAHIQVTTKFDILWTLQRNFNDTFIHEAANDLFEKTPYLSSSSVLSTPQKVFFIVLLMVLVVVGMFSVNMLLLILNAAITVMLCGTLTYKLILTVIGLTIPHYREQELLKLDTKDLPVYTVLLPLYLENEIILMHLVHKLDLLDYPKHLLDVKLVVEQDDLVTINALKSMHLPMNYEIIQVPLGGPRTKPKACNYALRFARGEFVTIYDAEDAPDPDQLRKVVASFRRENDERLACVQCRLSYYNIKENWMTKLFTLEYSYWFDLMLPALSVLKLPIPLGGTSNHLRTSLVKKISAWDPFNVTEDAELGIRLYQLGLRTAVIDSTTHEEAPCQLRNWFKQRTRWLKGYTQTYLVQMRHPIKSIRTLGFFGFLSFQFFIGGTVLSNLTNIIVWMIFAFTLYYGASATNFMFPSPIIELAWFNFIVGSLIVVVLNILAALRRKMYGLVLYSLTAPIYWLLMSAANWRAMWQLITKPSVWERTSHGRSKIYKATAPVAETPAATDDSVK